MFEIIDNKSTVSWDANFKTFNFDFSAIENLFECVKTVVFVAAFVLLSACSVLADDASDTFSEKGAEAGDRVVKVVNGVEFAFRWCPAGTFTMGSPESETGRKKDETQHQVTLSKGFWMMETEVTQQQWQAIMGDNPSSWKDDNKPVGNVSWNDCQSFCQRCLKYGLPVQLPTEAQWEYACRAGTTGAFAGDIKDMGCYKSDGASFSVSFYETVKKKSPNKWGLYDMHGNVCELCSDWYANYSTQSETDPKGPSSGSYRVMRGGCIKTESKFCRSANRGKCLSDYKNEVIGFRCVIGRGVSVIYSPIDSSDNSQSNVTQIDEFGQGAKAGERKSAVVNGVKFTFRWCPAGTFMMGATEDDKTRFVIERPQHQVTLSKGFWIMETEVTQEQWETVMNNNPSFYKGAKLPVECISWRDCQQFCKECAKLGLFVQLPTEAQWEYACRAGTTEVYPGDMEEMSWNYTNSDNRTHAVGKKKPNAWGIYDMCGNVKEWCQDKYEDYSSESVTDPTGASEGYVYVVRGGSSFENIVKGRSASRYKFARGVQIGFIGFRCVLSNDSQ